MKTNLTIWEKVKYSYTKLHSLDIMDCPLFDYPEEVLDVFKNFPIQESEILNCFQYFK